MSWSYAIWIARRLYYAEDKRNRSSRPAIRVALAGIAIGVMVMLITLCVVIGFKRTITDQVAGFGAHVQIVNFDNNNTYEMLPISFSDSLLSQIESIPYVAHTEPFITKPGIAKTDDAFLGIVLKSVEQDDYVASRLVEGTMPADDKQVLISTSQASALDLHTDDALFCYFIEDDNVRVRKFHISGIYRTGFTDFDQLFMWCRRPVLTALNGWDADQYSGLQIMADDPRHIYAVAESLYDVVFNRFDRNESAYFIQTIRDLNPQIFSWLDLLDMNVVVILILMLCVSGFSIIAGLVILILEAIQFVGVMKALGSDNHFLRRVFLAQASMLVFRGMLWGNILGLGLCALQYFTHLVPLDAATYYVDAVPVVFPWLWLVLLNVAVFAISFLIMLLPSLIVSRISPARVMHFE